MAMIRPYGVADSFGDQIQLFLRSAPYVAGYCVRQCWRPAVRQYVISGQGVDHETHAELKLRSRVVTLACVQPCTIQGSMDCHTTL
jgi:hypothetical protein